MVYRNTKTGAEIITKSVIKAPGWEPLTVVKKEAQEPQKIVEEPKEVLPLKSEEQPKPQAPKKTATKKRTRK
jgi:hypothetical protein